MTLPVFNNEPNLEPAAASAIVFRGSKSLCREFSLVLEAKNVAHETQEVEDAWVLRVPAPVLRQAYDEIARYSAERGVPRSLPQAIEARPGAVAGGMVYIAILLATAYCAGNGLLDADWLLLGDLDSATRGEWWRAITALTLHLDQEHLLGNILFGSVAGIAAGRLLGPGLAWASILGAAALANYTEALMAPITHRAVGASTAVFAALGMLAGMAWRQQRNLRARFWYRWAPLIAGICLLTLLGAGNARVDVLGHALGFIFGTGVGWMYSQLGAANNHSRRLQIVTGGGAVLLTCAAWLLALSHRAVV